LTGLIPRLGQAPRCHSDLMAKNFNADFYVTCATVIPVLFLAVAVQGPTYESLFKAALRADARTERRYASLALVLLNIAVVIVFAGSGGEGMALWTLYRGSEVSGWRGWVFGLTLFLVAVVVAGPVLSTLRWSGLLHDPGSLPRQAVSGEAEASEDQPAEPGGGSAGQAPER
jgi:hypothetical protein